MTIQARYIGDDADPHGPDEVTAFGTSFIKGQWTPVAKTYEAKIEGNTHFEIDTNGDGEADPDVADLRAQLDDLGVKYHPRAGLAKLTAMLEDATKPA